MFLDVFFFFALFASPKIHCIYTVHSSVHQINYSMLDTVLIKNSGQDIGWGSGGGVGFELETRYM